VERQAREASKREHRAQFKEQTLLQTQGSKLCHAIVGPLRARHVLSKGIRLSSLHHTKMTGELAALQAMLSSAVELVLGRSPDNTFHVEVMGKLATKF
jgi:hypothetical protein